MPGLKAKEKAALQSALTLWRAYQTTRHKLPYHEYLAAKERHTFQIYLLNIPEE